MQHITIQHITIEIQIRLQTYSSSAAEAIVSVTCCNTSNVFSMLSGLFAIAAAQKSIAYYKYKK